MEHVKTIATVTFERMKTVGKVGRVIGVCLLSVELVFVIRYGGPAFLWMLKSGAINSDILGDMILLFGVFIFSSFIWFLPLVFIYLWTKQLIRGGEEVIHFEYMCAVCNAPCDKFPEGYKEKEIDGSRREEVVDECREIFESRFQDINRSPFAPPISDNPYYSPLPEYEYYSTRKVVRTGRKLLNTYARYDVFYRCDKCKHEWVKEEERLISSLVINKMKIGNKVRPFWKPDSRPGCRPGSATP